MDIETAQLRTLGDIAAQRAAMVGIIHTQQAPSAATSAAAVQGHAHMPPFTQRGQPVSAAEAINAFGLSDDQARQITTLHVPIKNVDRKNKIDNKKEQN